MSLDDTSASYRTSKTGLMGRGNLRRPPKTCHSPSESWENGDSEYVIRYAGKIRPFYNFNICITSGTIFSGRI